MNPKNTMIYRFAKRSHPYVQIDKRPIEDNRLSWKAKGILAYLMSRPPNWEIRSDDVASRSTDKHGAVRSGMIELAKFGYAKLMSFRDPKTGRVSGRQWIAAETPELLLEHLSEVAVSRISEETGTEMAVSRISDKPNLGKKHATNKEQPTKIENTTNNESAPMALEFDLVGLDSRKTNGSNQSVVIAAYEAYPRRVGKTKALKAIRAAMKRDPGVDMAEAAMEYARAMKGANAQYIPYPATWFNRGSYLDDRSQWGERNLSGGLKNGGIIENIKVPILEADQEYDGY